MNIEALDKFDRMETSKPKEADKPFFEDSEPPDDMVSPILGGISKYEPENSPYSEIKTSDMPHWSDEPFFEDSEPPEEMDSPILRGNELSDTPFYPDSDMEASDGPQWNDDAIDIESLLDETDETDDPNTADVDDTDKILGCPIDEHGGHWEGERGNSKWFPNLDDIPGNQKTNPEQLTWKEILDKYGIDGITFIDGEPDFSEISKGTVEIDNYTDNRFGKGGNFDQACEKLAQQRGCTKEEVKAWMKENKYTWHERSDCKTMDKVPTEVHGNVRHNGGISQIKNSQNEIADTKEVS